MRVYTFDGLSFTLLVNFNAYTPGFTGGVRVDVGDVKGDTVADIFVAAGPGGGPHVRVFDGAALGPNPWLIHDFRTFKTAGCIL